MHECVHAWTDRRTCTCAHACLTHVQRVRHTVGNVTAAQSGPCGRSSAERPTVLARYGPRVVRKCAHDLCTDMDPSRGPMSSELCGVKQSPMCGTTKSNEGKGGLVSSGYKAVCPCREGNNRRVSTHKFPHPMTAIQSCKVCHSQRLQSFAAKV